MYQQKANHHPNLILFMIAKYRHVVSKFVRLHKGLKAKWILSILGLCLTLSGYAQELSNIGKSPVLTVDGGISANQVWNISDQGNNQRQPYSYILSANLNFSLYGWSIPVSAMYSNKNWSYQQPFNTFSLHPSYKWIRTHIGYSSMTFSSYTLNGHQFLGGGVELSPPGKWKFSAMAGRMQKRVLPDTAGTITPAFHRFGAGFKTEFTYEGGNFGVSMFYAGDRTSSLPFLADSSEVKPQRNIAFSVDGNFSPLQDVAVNFEYGTSLFTEDTRLAANGEKYALLPFFPRNNSSHQYHAFRANATYNSIIGSVGLGIERVDPGYNTLGAYYMTNDFVNYTVNYSGRMVKDIITLSLSSGLQMDDLNGNKSQRTKRLVNSLSVGISPSQKVNVNLNYSNFSTYTNVRTGFEDINNTSPVGYRDTLDYTQISQNTGIMVSLSPGKNENVRQNANFSVNYQQAADQQSDNPSHVGNRFINGMAGYSVGLTKSNLNLSAMLNYSHNKADSMVTVLVGPTFGVRKAVFNKKINLSLSVSYNSTTMNSQKQAGVFITRFSTSYNLQKRHIFDLGVMLANRNNYTRSSTATEGTITFTYRYSFSVFKKKGTEE